MGRATQESSSSPLQVRLVANCCEQDIDLGIKGKSGILESMTTHAAFLADPTHRIRFVYIPKHTSWLNQIECWFSILVRRLLKRASFTSVQDLRDSEALLRSADHIRPLAKVVAGVRWGLKLCDRSPAFCAHPG